MKKLFLCVVALASLGTVAEKLPSDFDEHASKLRLSLTLPQEDKEETLLLVMPGFNVKPNKLNFVLEAFAEQGIPGLLLSFAGCKEAEQNVSMTCDNWKKNADDAIKFVVAEAEKMSRKVIILGHSMGGLYAIHTLGIMEKNGLLANMKDHVKLALIAPADGLQSLLGIVGRLAPQISSALPQKDNNVELVEEAQKNFLFHMGLAMFPLGSAICGVNAAQTHVPLSAIHGLVAPTVDVIYPTVEAIVFFHENDGLMNPDHFRTYQTVFPSCTIVSLGDADNPVLAHTFEHFVGSPQLKATLIEPILNILK